MKADLEQEVAFIKEQLAAAKLEMTTGKEERIKWWRPLFEIILQKGKAK